MPLKSRLFWPPLVCSMHACHLLNAWRDSCLLLVLTTCLTRLSIAWGDQRMLGQLIYLAKHSLLLSVPSLDKQSFWFSQLFSKLICLPLFLVLFVVCCTFFKISFKVFSSSSWKLLMQFFPFLSWHAVSQKRPKISSTRIRPVKLCIFPYNAVHYCLAVF